MANGKKKGNRGEREVAKWWQAWTGFDFARVPASGGLRWKTDNTIGDITCTERPHDRRFLFSIECKFYKDINFEHLILGNKSTKILKFWQQTTEDAERGNKVPILFMRYNGMTKGTYFVVVSMPLYYELRNCIEHDQLDIQGTYFKVMNSEYKFVILNSNALLSIDYLYLHKHLKKLIRNGKKF